MLSPALRLTPIIATAIAVLALPHMAAAQDVMSFYKGKQIKLIIGSSAGGGYDTYGRVIARHMGKHIPGKPRFVVQNMPGSSSRKAANYLYNIAPKDGTAIAGTFSGIPAEPLMNPSVVKFDALKFNWIGSAARDAQAGMVWTTAPAQTLNDVMTKEMIVGASGGATHDFPMLANAILGTKFKIIAGYKGTKGIGLAMERGEVQGNAGTTWSSIKTQHTDWLKQKKIRVFVQYGRTRHPELPDVPLMIDLAKSEADRQALNLSFARQDFARPYVAPPALPAARIKALRSAFNATMVDQAFLKDAAKRRIEIAPLKAEEMIALIKNIYATPPEVVARVQNIVSVSKKRQKKAKKKK
ncbi:MAG: tripartite-type tricarboxylate transporter receptor subunit TctC [Alphaproteobacteria bacterium]|jgi:tripartite-type tricarboxylate transporter receptor subunit TctC